jgi:hypothetical protein
MFHLSFKMSNKIFKSIKNFVSDLGESFSNENHSLALYERLISKTNLSHTEAVEKHITIFRKFCIENEDNIINKKPEFNQNIDYSQKVFLDMNNVFKLEMDNDTRENIWLHLLTITALVHPSGKAKETLKEETNVNNNAIVNMKFDGQTEEENFLNGIISKVEQHVNTDMTNPQEAISNIMNSGMITDLVQNLNTGISSGKLDLMKMMGSVQKMVGNISQDSGAGADPNMANAMSMLTNMMSMMPNNS